MINAASPNTHGMWKWEGGPVTVHAALQNRVAFLINNISPRNVDSKVNEMRELISQELWPWFANYMVVKRAAQVRVLQVWTTEGCASHELCHGKNHVARALFPQVHASQPSLGLNDIKSIASAEFGKASPHTGSSAACCNPSAGSRSIYRSPTSMWPMLSCSRRWTRAPCRSTWQSPPTSTSRCC